MCDECKRRYDALEEKDRASLEENARGVVDAALKAWRDGGVDPITMIAGLDIGLQMLRSQFDAGTLSVAEAIAARGMATVRYEYAKRGLRLEPRPHTPIEFVPAPPEPPRAQVPEGRPVREPPDHVRRARRVH